jgi:hypothetical protein
VIIVIYNNTKYFLKINNKKEFSMGEAHSANKTPGLYDILPFMEAFPFEDYEIEVEPEGDDISKEVSSILIKTLGAFGASYNINFQYFEDESAVVVSFHEDDILYLTESAVKVKKMDSVLQDLLAGLASSNIKEKIEGIKKSKKFIKQLENDNLTYTRFEPFLSEMLKLNDAVLENELMLELHKLKPKKILEKNLSPEQAGSIAAYLNFQLHYCKILLGIVIAIKIH